MLRLNLNCIPDVDLPINKCNWITNRNCIHCYSHIHNFLVVNKKICLNNNISLMRISYTEKNKIESI